MKVLTQKVMDKIAKLAKKYSWLGLSEEDLISEALCGIIEKDPKDEAQIVSRARWSMLEAIDKKSRVIRIPYKSLKKIPVEKRVTTISINTPVISGEGLTYSDFIVGDEPNAEDKLIAHERVVTFQAALESIGKKDAVTLGELSKEDIRKIRCKMLAA